MLDSETKRRIDTARKANTKTAKGDKLTANSTANIH